MIDIAVLTHRVERLEHRHAIERLMARRAYVHSPGLNAAELDECWSRRDDMAFEAEDWGVWEGRAAVRQAYVDGNPFPDGTKGMLIEHPLTTAVIEVADDFETAKGVWISPGHETFPVVPCGPPEPHWCWGRYSVDFVRDDGEWRVWHLHVLATFRTPYAQSWVDSALRAPDHFTRAGQVMDGITPPTRPVTFNQPYHPDAAPAHQPVPPQPYRTWSEVTSYTDPLE
ncbi:nuclear transport factor 2 family protein [Streptomyces sp. NPDC047043]|uniref:nuclear transport factor 2 family protein n=1 Tax=Streptomyces sp. NPDC047043 TaxID=3154497 RepID=UPI00340BE037